MKTEKQELREKFRNLRDEVNESDFHEFEKRILARIKSNESYQKAKTVGIYYPLHSEISLLSLAEDFKKRFCFPKITDFSQIEMNFFWHTGKFSPGRFGLSEPIGPKAEKEAIDIIIVPGLVFSRDGYRIGYGKGFFDKYLASYTKPKIGVAMSFQVTDTLPYDVFDVKMDFVITDEEEICIPH
ncbi:MAG: 5-formyltetrahydrofolate cyclo-ligase [Bacilli bacterium]|nr:5-formyltetrahydrofolate cyclo-ligase [Bacilli bacterium]MBN2696646.1 5-formyltetrahydrofolate cyclo-ligase [Bacilli bacterium]